MLDNMSLTHPILIGSVMGLIGISGIFLAVYWMFIKKRIINIVLAKHGDTYRRIKQVKKPLGTETFTFKDNEYCIDTKHAFLNHRDNPTLFYTLGNAMPLKFNPIDKDVDSGVFRHVLKSNAYAKLLSGYHDKTFMGIILGLGVLFLVIVGFQQYTIFKQGKQIEIYAEMLYNLTKTDDIFIPQLTALLRSMF
jgi:hypothetical protein